MILPDSTGEPFGVAPVHVFITLILSALGVLGFLWRMTRSLANVEMKINFLWKDFQKRYKMHNGSDE